MSARKVSESPTLDVVALSIYCYYCVLISIVFGYLLCLCRLVEGGPLDG